MFNDELHRTVTQVANTIKKDEFFIIWKIQCHIQRYNFGYSTGTNVACVFFRFPTNKSMVTVAVKPPNAVARASPVSSFVLYLLLSNVSFAKPANVAVPKLYQKAFFLFFVML